MSFILPKLKQNEKFHSFAFNKEGWPIAAIEVYVQESLPEEKFFYGHKRIVLRKFESIDK